MISVSASILLILMCFVERLLSCALSTRSVVGPAVSLRARCWVSCADCGGGYRLRRCVDELPSSGKFCFVFSYIDVADHQFDAVKIWRRTGELVGMLLGRTSTPATKENDT